MQAKQIGIHVLTAYPPSNPNRDENGQPKTAIVNGITRQRISSQCIKRSWRLSEIMKVVEGRFSVRTRRLGLEVEATMVKAGMDPKAAKKRALSIASVFGNKFGKNPLEHKEMVIVGHEEWDAAIELANSLAKENRDPTEDELAGLQRDTTSVDVAMFGRMRAAAAKFKVDASVYVAHPLTTGKATLDADFWTAVDDLKHADDDADSGTGGMDETEFGSGTYYTYVQVNRDALIKNLNSNEKLASEVITKLIEAIANVSPSGHKTTFGNEVRASYLRVEVGQPSGNLYCKAYEDPINGTRKAIKALRDAAEAEAVAYGLEQKTFEFSPPETLASVIAGVTKALEPQ